MRQQMLYDIKKTNWALAGKLRASINTEEYEQRREAAFKAAS